MEYINFELEINEGEGGQFSISAKSPQGEARETLVLPFDELELESRLQKLEIALLRSGGTRRLTLSPQDTEVQKFGTALFHALFTGDIGKQYAVNYNQAKDSRKGLRIRLRIQPPELAALPWEFMYDGDQSEYMVLSTRTPLVRYLELPQSIPPLRVKPPLRVLGMIASPNDLPGLNVEREKTRVEKAVERLRAKGVIELTWLEGQRSKDLQRALRSGQGPWHIFHFIGHGGFNTQADEGLIALVNEDGGTDRLTARDLARLLGNHMSIRLVVLNSCDGAKGGKTDVFSSTASILVRRGIPAVIAMQYEITDRAAIEFAQELYESLADGLPIDVAVTEARTALSVRLTNTYEWGTPVLHLRAPDGTLFEVDKRGVDQKQPAAVDKVNGDTVDSTTATTAKPVKKKAKKKTRRKPAAKKKPTRRKTGGANRTTTARKTGNKKTASMTEPYPGKRWLIKPQDNKSLIEERRKRTERIEQAKATATPFYGHWGFWLATALTLILTPAAVFGAEVLARMIPANRTLLPDAPLVAGIVLVMLWVISQAALGAANYWADPDRGAAAFFTRGILGGYTLYLEDYELVGLWAAFPMSTALAWLLARWAAWLPYTFFGWSYLAIFWLVLGTYTLPVLFFYVLSTLDSLDNID